MYLCTNVDLGSQISSFLVQSTQNFADFASLLRPPAGRSLWRRARSGNGYEGREVAFGYELSADSAVAAALAKLAGYGPQADG